MLDTQTAPEGIVADTPRRGPYPRIRAAAIERAKVRFGTAEISKIGELLGYRRQNFWRARTGEHDTRLSHAKRIARQLNMPLDEVFEGGNADA